MLAAEKAGKSPEQFIAEIAKGRKQYLDGFHIEFDNWHSTHSKENTELSQDIYRKLKAAKLIYSKKIEQSSIRERHVPRRPVHQKGECRIAVRRTSTETHARMRTVYSPTKLEEPYSTLSGAKPVLKSSDHFFFSYQTRRALRSCVNGWKFPAG